MREGMRICEVYNDGLTVYLYDEAALPSLREVGGVLLHGAEDDQERKRAVKRIAKERSLVSYELIQDDSLHVGVIVGRPLTAKERKNFSWLAPMRSLLSLPSGRLCIESTNALRIDPAESPMERGAMVEVAPGEYVLTLHRVDWRKLEDYKGPTEIVALTPRADVSRPPAFKLRLELPRPKTAAPPPDDRPRAVAARELMALARMLDVKADGSLAAFDTDLPAQRALSNQLVALGAELVAALDEPAPASLYDALTAAESEARRLEEDYTADRLAAVRRTLGA